ncbi:cell division protein FtsL [Seohaeicola saemankumensis]|uniref:Cell division protein FtsL n=1 Tax=Seohaeicola saemankumensis TaxID=481181 RepID=A0ABW3T9G5_9RHOB|nr:cell division protein FtsL [Paracoccaceae bacterium]
MRSVLFVLTACAVIGLAFWAYRENYRTQQALDVTEQLQRDIGASRARLAVLRAEWAYLNRPERLRDLADLNFDSLGLMPMAPEQFGRIDQVAFPPAEEVLLPITDPIEVSNTEVRP